MSHSSDSLSVIMIKYSLVKLSLVNLIQSMFQGTYTSQNTEQKKSGELGLLARNTFLPDIVELNSKSDFDQWFRIKTGVTGHHKDLSPLILVLIFTGINFRESHSF